LISSTSQFAGLFPLREEIPKDATSSSEKRGYSKSTPGAYLGVVDFAFDASLSQLLDKLLKSQASSFVLSRRTDFE